MRLFWTYVIYSAAPGTGIVETIELLESAEICHYPIGGGGEIIETLKQVLELASQE